MKKVEVLRQEFAAITDLVAAGAVKETSRETLFAFWGEAVQKIGQFDEAIRDFLVERRLASLKVDHGDGEKVRRLADIDRELDQILEKKNPGCLSKYVAALELRQEFERYVAFIETLIVQTAPPRETIVSVPGEVLQGFFAPKSHVDTTRPAGEATPVTKRGPRRKADKEPGSDQGMDRAAPAAPLDAGPAQDRTEKEVGLAEVGDASDDSVATVPSEPVEGSPADAAEAGASRKSTFQKLREGKI